MPKEESIFDKASKGIGAAFIDAREKIEEIIWGRVVNERDTQTGPQWPQAREPEPSFGSITREIDKGPTHDQMRDNANYRLSAMERELNGPQWPQAKQSELGHNTGHGRSTNIEDRERERGSDIDR